MSIELFIGAWAGLFIGLIGKKVWGWVFRDTTRTLPVLKVSRVSAVALHSPFSILAAMDGHYQGSLYDIRYSCELTKEQAERLRDLLSDQIHNLRRWRDDQEC